MALTGLILIVAIFILIEERRWHVHLEKEQQAQQEAASKVHRKDQFIEAEADLRDAVRRHAGEVYGCQNGMTEREKLVWIRWKRVDAELRELRNRADLEDYLSDPSNLREAHNLIAMANQLVLQAIAPLQSNIPEWMLQRPEWNVTAEDIRREHFYGDTEPSKN